MYSLRDSIIRPEEIPDKLSRIGQSAIAITDHGNLLSGVSIYKILTAADMKYIHGCEVYVCPDTSIRDKNNKYYHLVLLCLNETGRLNLNHLVTESNKPENFYSKPRVDYNMLRKYHNGLLAMSACIAGEISSKLLSGEYEEAIASAEIYRSIFGENFYIEIQSHSDETQINLNRQLVSLAKDMDIPVVVTTDAHYLEKEDKEYQNKYAFNGKYKEDGEAYVDCYIQSEDEVREKLSYLPPEIIKEAIDNTEIIAAKCNVELPLSAPIMPKITIPKGYSNGKAWLNSICEQGFRNKLNINLETRSLFNLNKKLQRTIYDGDGRIQGIEEYQLTPEQIQKYINRYNFEIDSLEKMGFIDYILLVYSYVNVGTRRGIARGSGGGSLVNYLADITDIDPLEHGLYFERFIDVGALDKLESGEITAKELKIPDIDTDFSGDSCKEVLDFLYNTYGEQRVASIGKFGTNHTNGTIRDMCKVFGIDLKTEDVIAKAFSDFEMSEIDSMIAGETPVVESARDAIQYVKEYPELFRYVRKLIGLPKSFGLHACFPAGTMVLTSKGYEPIETLHVGDMVLTHNNRYQKINKLWQHKSEYTITIRAQGMYPVTCTPEHPFLVKRRIDRNRLQYYEPEWVSAIDLQYGDLIAVAVNQNSIIPKYKDLPTDNPDFWWIVGRFIESGTIQQTGRIKKAVIRCNNIKEMDRALSKIEQLFDYTSSITSRTISIINSDLFGFLMQFGVLGNRRVPGSVIDLPKEFLAAFLEGLFSAESKFKKNISYELEIKPNMRCMVMGIKQCVLKAFGRYCDIDSRNNKRYLWFSLEEKNSVVRRKYDGKYLWVNIKSAITNEHETIVYNLSVNEDESYTANEFVVHNCGKVISTRELDEFLPSCYDSDGIRYLQGDMHDVEDVGLVKIDVLGLRTLDQEYDTLEQTNQSKTFISSKQDFSDPKVLDIFRKGDTVGIFQMSSPGMKQTLKKMDVRGIDDLSIANALFRPGAIRYINNFCDRRTGKEEVVYIHPDLEPILKNTYGIMVFQEQLIEIGRMAGLRNPDMLRKATGKKDAKLLAKVKPELFECLSKRGWSEAQIEQLWADMLEFAKYSFNKCVDGNTTIRMANNNAVSHTVKELYALQECNDNPSILEAYSMNKFGQVVKNKIVNISYQGVKQTYWVATESGAFVNCTSNHKFPTPHGVKELSQLRVGDWLYVSSPGLPEVTKEQIMIISPAKIRDVYDIEMEAPNHNFITESGLVVSNSHSSAYAIVAYATAKQKAYYPLEFYAGLCNSYLGESSYVKDNADEIISDLYNHHLRLAPFDYHNDHRRCNCKNNKLVYAIPLIRDCSATTADTLYSISNNNYDYFVELLIDLMATQIKKSQIKILIKLGFFKDFGNSKMLLRLYDVFEQFKFGETASISKSKLENAPEIREIVKRYSNSKTKDGKESATFKILNIKAILRECEEYIRTLNISDFSIKDKLATQREYLGFAPVATGKEEDRPYLIVNQVYPLYTKNDNRQFGYSIIANSIGSGKQTRYSIYNRHYKYPLKEGDIIYCKKYESQKGYFNLTNYEIIA